MKKLQVKTKKIFIDSKELQSPLKVPGKGIPTDVSLFLNGMEVGTQVHQDCAVPHLLILKLVTQIISSVYVVPVVVLSSLSGVMDKKHRPPELVEFVVHSNEDRKSTYKPQSLIRKCRPMKTHICKCFRF